MGTGGPPVTVRAATLAGGKKNQDRYAYGDGWAFVLDGASSFATEQPEHDGGWYAERLKDALVDELTSHPDDATTDIVARAIEDAASAHEDPESCPTSTIAMARWATEMVEVYVLGDSSAVLISKEGEEEVTDSRMGSVAPEVRASYHSRLAQGHGFDTRHRELLEQLQIAQGAARNRPNGYWIAGSDPVAAHHALHKGLPKPGVHTLMLGTDGARAGLRYGLIPTWSAIEDADPNKFLQKIADVEDSDPLAARWPRSKPSDDKSLLIVKLR